MTTPTIDEKCYELASWWLEDASYRHLSSDDNAQALGSVIQRAIDDWIDDANENYDGAPYCNAGHKSAASCDCGPIADNE